MRKQGEILYSLRRYELMDGNFTQISNDAFKLTNAYEFKVYSYLCYRYDEELKCSCPSLKEIYENTNISIRTISRCIIQLEKLGLIQRAENKIKFKTNNKYKIYVPIIENNNEKEEEKELKAMLEEMTKEIENKFFIYEVKDDKYYNSSRKSYTYTKWREDVLKRDDYTCRLCGRTNKDAILNVHHIEKYTDNEELRTNIDNGITLCCDCHKKIFGKEKEYEEYFKMLIGGNTWEE